jgi:hypothetical protein
MGEYRKELHSRLKYKIVEEIRLIYILKGLISIVSPVVVRKVKPSFHGQGRIIVIVYNVFSSHPDFR